MLMFDTPLGKNYAFEIAIIHTVRSLSDGLTVLDCKLNADWYRGDHSPRFEFELMVLNVMILEVRIYNRHHEEQ